MAYVAPRTWTTGELVTAAMMNQDVRDNMVAVKTLVDTIYTVTWTEPARALDTEYQNSTKIRIVSISVGLTAGDDETVVIRIGAASPPATQVQVLRSNNAGIVQMGGTIVLPTNWYYDTVTINGPTLVDWHEWDLF